MCELNLLHNFAAATVAEQFQQRELFIRSFHIPRAPRGQGEVAMQLDF